jgi:hypothetical protein
MRERWIKLSREANLLSACRKKGRQKKGRGCVLQHQDDGNSANGAEKTDVEKTDAEETNY